MDIQQVLAAVYFSILTSIMFYGFFHIEKTIKLITKIYGVFGIKLEFSKRGKTLVKMTTLFLTIVFLIGTLSVIFWE